MLTDDAAYPPLNVPKPLADGVWIVDAKPIRAMNVLVLPLRMTIFRLGNGDLLLYSPTQYRQTLHANVETLGPIKHLVAPSTGHWMFVADWQRHCPRARTWAVPNLATRRAVRDTDLRFDALLGTDPPAAWAGEIEHVLFRGPGYDELNMVHLASGTAVVTDTLVQVRAESLPPLSRAVAFAAGICAPIGRSPRHLRALLSLNRKANAAAARRLVGLAPKRVVVAHGDVIDRNVSEHLRHSLDWLENKKVLPTGIALAGIGVLAAATAIAVKRRHPRRRRRIARR